MFIGKCCVNLIVATGSLGLLSAAGLAQPEEASTPKPSFVVRAGDAIFTVERTLSMPANPHGIAFSADGQLAYVSCEGDNVIAVVDTESLKLLRTLPAGSEPLDVFLTPDGGTLITTQFRSDALVRVPLDGSGPKTRIDVSLSPSLFSRKILGKRYVTCEFGDRVFELDRSGKPLRSWSTAKQPYPADATSDGILLFVPARADNAVAVIDTLNNRTAATVSVGENPEGGAVTLDDVNYIVACGGSNDLRYINTASFTVVDTIKEGVGPRPFGVTMTLDGRFALINNAGGASVSVLDVAAHKIVGALKVGEKPIVVRAHPDGDRLFVSSENANTLTVIRVRTPAPKYASAGATEVAVMGMIHGGHRTSERYSLETVKNFIRVYKPDYVLTEMPPNRFDAAMEQWKTTGEITEQRIKVFPEYVDALFPLLKEMDFSIIPTAGWTAEMNDYRNAMLDKISKDPKRQSQMAEHRKAMERMQAAIKALGPADDPMTIHTDAYDKAIDEGYGGPYTRYFNDDLVDGGWNNINAKHYAHIAHFLDSIKGQGKRVLVTYGAAHKEWFLKRLRKREDVKLLDPRPFFRQASSR